MTAQWRRAEEIFLELSEVGHECRAALIEARCAGDGSLRAEVESLLEHLAAPEEFLNPEEVRALADVEPASLTPPQRVGEYTILGLLGSGGMGVVYVAEQQRPRRTVALKLIRRGASDSAILRRFEQEAEVLGRLQHPGIAQIFAAGVAETGAGPCPYIAMELVEGSSLLEHAERGRLGRRARLELMARVCEAVQHAHQRGIIHCDLKPGNILVDARGQPKVLDFGVARAVDRDVQLTTMQTSAGQLIGTLSYMSPEQVEGDWPEVDTRSDVYALGVILHELLAGRPPHDLAGRSIAEAARVILEEPRARLGARARELRGDPETIVAKALERDKSRRYQSAAQLAEDIRRHLAGQPIVAKHDSRLYVLGKQLRQHRGAVAAAVLAILALAAFALQSGIQAGRNRELAERERASARAAERARDIALRTLYFNRIGFAQASYLGHDIERMRRVLDECPRELRGWEWNYLRRISDTSDATVRAHPGGTGAAAISRAGGRIATWRNTEDVPVWSADDGRPIARITPGTQTSWAALSPDGSLAAVGGLDGTVELWEVEGVRRWTVKVLRKVVRGCAFSADGALLAVAGQDPHARVLRVEDGAEVMALPVASGIAVCAAFRSPAGGPRPEMLAIGDDAGRIRLWDLGGPALLREFRENTHAIRWLVFHPDGKRLLSAANDSTVRIWDAGEPGDDGGEWEGGARVARSIGTLRVHSNKVGCIDISPDGTTIASGGTDAAIQLTNIGSGEVVQTLRGHEESITFVGYTRYGHLVTSGRDGALKWWGGPDQPTEPTAIMEGTPRSGVIAAAFSADGDRVYVGGAPRLLAELDGRTLDRIGVFDDVNQRVQSLDVRGRLMATGGEGGIVRVWELDGRRERAVITAAIGMVYAVRFDPAPPPGAGRIAAGGADGVLRVWTVDGEPVASADLGEPILGISWRDGRIAAACGDGRVRVWNARMRRVEAVLGEAGPPVWDAAFTPDGRVLSAGEDGTVRVWSVEEGTCRVLHGHKGPVHCVAASPDGSRVISGGFDNTARLWDMESGEELLTLRGHMGAVHAAAFSRDGLTILSASNDGMVKVWSSAEPESESGGAPAREGLRAGRREERGGPGPDSGCFAVSLSRCLAGRSGLDRGRGFSTIAGHAIARAGHGPSGAGGVAQLW